MKRRKPVVRKPWYTRLMDVYRYSPVRIGLLNPLIRGAFVLKARGEVAAALRRPLAAPVIEEWFASHDVFFGFSVVRSGSVFLADLLNKASDDTIVQHEANVNDYYFYHSAWDDPRAAEEYVREYRLGEIVTRLRPFECRVYGEINPFLNRHCAAIRKVLPGARTFHLVRDGRKVVRSLLAREHFARNDPMARLKVPPKDDRYFGSWDEMSRFEKLCWLWQAENRYMRDNIERTVQFEQIVSDYAYLAEQILEPLEIEMDQATWAAHKQTAANRTPRHRAPPYEDWTAEHKATFVRICGDEMEACGYRL